jgi:hypothetical protein
MADIVPEVIDKLVNLQLAFPANPLAPELTPEIERRIETMMVDYCVRFPDLFQRLLSLTGFCSSPLINATFVSRPTGPVPLLALVSLVGNASLLSVRIASSELSFIGTPYLGRIWPFWSTALVRLRSIPSFMECLNQ